jgi:hypothetical protein
VSELDNSRITLFRECPHYVIDHIDHVCSVTLKEIRSDLFDAYVYIQEKLPAALKEAVPHAPAVDVTKCSVTGGSAGGSATMWLVGPYIG